MATADAQYKLYLDSVLALARTLTVKHAATADAINTDLMQRYEASADFQYFVNLADPTGWKYYLNLAGQYHMSDTPMTVKSQDTLQFIDFTVANLKDHTATKAAYAPGGRYYNDLLTQYPTQEQLIRGILNPVDKTTAINATDGTVLWFDPTLVESNEWNLIPDLERWLINFMGRWDVTPYGLVDDLYIAAFLGVMYMLIPPVILGLRLFYCFTPQVHSFHVRAFLAGHGQLDQYVDSMTKSQQLWFYRNIRYILRNSGKQQIFAELLQHVMTERGLPLSDWTMQHDLTDLQETGFPTVEFKRHALNLALSNNGNELRTISQMLDAEAPAARSNSSWQTDGQLETVTETLSKSASDSLRTKVLESSVLDLSDASAYTLSDCLLNHWMYFAATGRYPSVVTVPNPVTGDTYNLTAHDAFIVFVYCFSVGVGDPLVTIPKFTANKVRRPVTPTVSDLRKLVDPDTVSDAQLQQLIDVMPPLTRQYISIAGFNQAVRGIHQAELIQHQLFSTQGHLWARAYLEEASFALYQDIDVDFGIGTNYHDWFADQNLDIPNLSPTDQATLAQNILIKATGSDLAVVESLADLQAAMIRIMQQLSSYSVQYLKSINSSPVRVIERPSVRIGDTTLDGKGELQFLIPVDGIEDEQGSGAHRITNPMIADVTAYHHDASGVAEFSFGSIVRMENNVAIRIDSLIPVAVARLRLLTDNVMPTIPAGMTVDVDDYLPLNLVPLPQAFTDLNLGFYTVTTTDQAALQARYDAVTNPDPPVLLLSDTLIERHLDTLAL